MGHNWVNKWATSFFTYRNTGFRRFVFSKFLERGAKFSLLSGVLVPKQTFQKRDGSHHLFQILVLVVASCCCY